MNKQTNEQMNKWTNEQMKEKMTKPMNGEMNQQMNKWTNKQANKQINKQTNKQITSSWGCAVIYFLLARCHSLWIFYRGRAHDRMSMASHYIGGIMTMDSNVMTKDCYDRSSWQFWVSCKTQSYKITWYDIKYASWQDMT